MDTPITSKCSFRYRLHGLAVETAIHFPELLPGSPEHPPDFVIRLGKAPAALANPQQRGVCYEAQPGQLLIWLDGVARFLVTDGRTITVDSDPAAPASEIRRLLLSSPLGALLLQRGLLPLHASAISTDEGAILFLGGPCTGKSTLAAMFRRRGFKILSDDLTAIRFSEEGVPWALPGYSQLRLWPDSLAAIGEDATRLARIREDIEKRLLPCPENFASSAMPLRAIILLGPGRQMHPEVLPLRGARGAGFLLSHTYSSAFLAGLGVQKTHFSQIARLAKETRMIRAAWPQKDCVTQDLAERLWEDFRS